MEQKQREEKVRQAIANERLEGLSVSKDTQRVLDDYIVGKVSAKEAARQVFTRYGAK